MHDPWPPRQPASLVFPPRPLAQLLVRCLLPQEVLSEGQPSTTGTSATSWAPSLPAFVPQCLRLLRGLTLFSLSAAGSAVAAAGLGLLAYLLLSRTLTPAQHLHTRPLFLDYSASDLLAQAAFLPSEYDLGSGAVLPDLPASTRCGCGGCAWAVLCREHGEGRNNIKRYVLPGAS